MARLKVKYTEEVAPALFKKFGYKSTMQIPKIDKVVVEGVAFVTKHQKARRQGQTGGIFQKERAIDASNVMLVCPKCGKATRVAHRIEEVTLEDGSKKTKSIRVCKRCKADID